MDDLGIPLFSETPSFPVVCQPAGICLVVFPSTTTELATVHQPGKCFFMNDGISSEENGPKLEPQDDEV